MDEELRKLKTTCLECGQEFYLDWKTVSIKYPRYDDDGHEPIIQCPHCKIKYSTY